MKLKKTHTIPEGIKKSIHVNPLKLNQPTESDPMCLIVRAGKYKFDCHHVKISGESRLVQNLRDPLSGGIKAWVETMSEITLYEFV